MTARPGSPSTPAPPVTSSGPPGEAAWWACHLLGEVLLRLPDATGQLGVLRQLADHAERTTTDTAPAQLFGPWFWRRVPVGTADRLDLLRRLLPADDSRATGDRYLTTAGELLAADPRTVPRLLCRWFEDERPLRDGAALTVASAAQALLHTHRRRAVDQLTEALVEAAHPRADELLTELAQDEPAALCRAIARWSQSDRPARRVAAAAYAARVLPYACGEADRLLLRQAAEALLSRPDDTALHGTALLVLIRDPVARPRHLVEAARRFADGTGCDPVGEALAGALAQVLPTHPEPVLAAFRRRLLTDRCADGTSGSLLDPLAAVAAPAPARQVAGLVREYAESCPLTSPEPVARFVERRLRHGTAARAVLQPLVAELLRSGVPGLRAALGRVLGRGSGTLRAELLDGLLAQERDAAVLEQVLDAVVRSGGGRGLVHRLGLLMARTPEGARAFDHRLVRLARELPGFADQAGGWLRGAPADWAAVVGPNARRELGGTVTEPEPTLR